MDTNQQSLLTADWKKQASVIFDSNIDDSQEATHWRLPLFDYCFGYIFRFNNSSDWESDGEGNNASWRYNDPFRRPRLRSSGFSECEGEPIDTAEEAAEILAAVDRATRLFKLCPNRVWEAVKYSPGSKANLPKLVPASINPGVAGRSTSGQDHSFCSFELCEYSRVDFTSIPQRHELPCQEGSCEVVKDMFPTAVLVEAANQGQPTAWSLEGGTTLDPLERYMAISHVWSDGTGAGAWGEGQVNSCLLKFFTRIARRFGCKGIWWDTLCIPREKAARSKAVQKVQENYENARLTLVHDCFLRDWEWTNPDDACFAIVMSPWFSRGWTALELASSRRVKIIFKGPADRPLIKDLDEDILPHPEVHLFNSPDPSYAAVLISSLRNRIINPSFGTELLLDDLLMIIGPRHTSWPRDIPIICGLLARVDMGGAAPQQRVYQRILTKFGQIHYGNLFHNSATMSTGSGFTWCAANLLDMQPARASIGTRPLDAEQSPRTLVVEGDGGIVGLWLIVHPECIPYDRYAWEMVHPLIGTSILLALRDKKNHVLLVEPLARTINRAILVKVMRRSSATSSYQYHVPCHCQFVGVVYFRPQVSFLHAEPKIKSMERVMRLGGTAKLEEIEGDVWNYLWESCQIRYRMGDLGRPLFYNFEPSAEERQENGVGEDGGDKDPSSQLFKACANGDLTAVNALLENGADPNIQDVNGQTPLHHAVWGTRQEVVNALAILSNIDAGVRDKFGQEAIHLAAERGNADCFRMLLTHRRDDRATMLEALHCAIHVGSRAITHLLLPIVKEAGNINQYIDGKTALHLSAEMGDVRVTDALLQDGAWPFQTDEERGRIPLQIAVENEHYEVVKLLVWEAILELYEEPKRYYQYFWEKSTLRLRMAVDREFDSLPPSAALAKYLEQVSDEWCGLDDTDLWIRADVRDLLIPVDTLKNKYINWRDNDGKTVMHIAAEKGHSSILAYLLMAKADPDIPDSKLGSTPLQLAILNNRDEATGLLARETSRIDHKDTDGKTALDIAFEMENESIVKILLQVGTSAGVPGGAGEPVSLHVADEEERFRIPRTPAAVAASLGD